MPYGRAQGAIARPKGLPEAFVYVSDVYDTHGNHVTRWENGDGQVQLHIKIPSQLPVTLEQAREIEEWYWRHVAWWQQAHTLMPLMFSN